MYTNLLQKSWHEGFLGSLEIRETQHAFVEGRQILNVVNVANELVADLVGGKKEGLIWAICKLDMEKAYDNVSWSFVDYMLCRFGLGQNGDF